jgi:hypothetical protein
MRPDPRLQIISELHSPLFRIMWVTNPDDLSRRQFDNNIVAFHIGNGIILTVAHNLRSEPPFLKSIPETVFREQLLPMLDASRQQLFLQTYTLDTKTNVRHITVNDAALVQSISESFRSVGFDMRWVTQTEQRLSIPHLIVQFRENSFYRDDALTSQFSNSHFFFEPTLNRYTFLLPIEKISVHYGADIAVYRIKNMDAAVVGRLPSVAPDFTLLDHRSENLYCLQSSPAGFLGRLLNEARIEGYLDQYQVFNDRIGGNYVLEGARYLIKGYFRFGSSGAPYLVYDEEKEIFRVNAIQSEASPVQLTINHNREGNFQYVNAIASPLHLIEADLKKLMNISVL